MHRLCDENTKETPRMGASSAVCAGFRFGKEGAGVLPALASICSWARGCVARRCGYKGVTVTPIECLDHFHPAVGLTRWVRFGQTISHVVCPRAWLVRINTLRCTEQASSTSQRSHARSNPDSMLRAGMVTTLALHVVNA